MLLALAGAALLVGAFIIFNTFSITVAQRTREFALLRALGSTRRQIVAAVAGEAFDPRRDRLGRSACSAASASPSCSARCSTPPASASPRPAWSSPRARSSCHSASASASRSWPRSLPLCAPPASLRCRRSPATPQPSAARRRLAPWIAAIVSAGRARAAALRPVRRRPGDRPHGLDGRRRRARVHRHRADGPPHRAPGRRAGRLAARARVPYAGSPRARERDAQPRPHRRHRRRR